MASLATCLAAISAPAAKAVNLQTFDLVFTAYSNGVLPITGSISLDLDAIVDDYPLAPLPPWLNAIELRVDQSNPGDPPYVGTFSRSDFSLFEWNSGGNTLDFTTDLVGQGGWGSRYQCPTCSLLLKNNDPNDPLVLAPYSDYYFQMVARVYNPAASQRGVYYGLSRFAPVPAGSATGAPAPLPLLGGAAALSWSRRLRQRSRLGCGNGGVASQRR